MGRKRRLEVSRFPFFRLDRGEAAMTRCSIPEKTMKRKIAYGLALAAALVAPLVAFAAEGGCTCCPGCPFC